MEEKTTIQLHCFFCGSTQFALPNKNYQPKAGEQIKCSNCGRTNDYDSLMRVAKSKATKWAKEQAQKKMDDFAKQIGKIFK